MNKLSDNLPLSSSLHHAYILTGESSLLVPKIKEYLNERFGSNYAVSNNPDFWLADLPTWGVEESRTLKEVAGRRAVNFPAKVFIISAHLITLEAQNSLLKTLEEPAPDTHFFIVAKQIGLFLPTVLSRCQLLDLSSFTRSDLIKSVERIQTFLKADISERLKIVKDILKEQEDDQSSGVNFLNDLTSSYWQKIQSDLLPEKLKGAEALRDASGLAEQRGSSLRLLLEYVAGVVPMV